MMSPLKTFSWCTTRPRPRSFTSISGTRRKISRPSSARTGPDFRSKIARASRISNKQRITSGKSCPIILIRKINRQVLIVGERIMSKQAPQATPQARSLSVKSPQLLSRASRILRAGDREIWREGRSSNKSKTRRPKSSFLQFHRASLGRAFVRSVT